jgi:hypothetical protein
MLPNLDMYTAAAAYGQIGFQLIELANGDPATGRCQLIVKTTNSTAKMTNSSPN